MVTEELSSELGIGEGGGRDGEDEGDGEDDEGVATERLTHAVLALSLFVLPSSHCLQMIDPGVALKVPGEQSTHCALSVAPKKEPIVPAGHEAHSCNPDAPPYVPCGHRSQDDAPVVEEPSLPLNVLSRMARKEV